MEVWNKKESISSNIVLSGTVRIEAIAKNDDSELVINLGLLKINEINQESIEQIQMDVNQRLLESFDDTYTIQKIALLSVDGKNIYSIIDKTKDGVYRC